LKNAKSLVEWIAWAEPQYNFNPMIDEWCKEAPKELDFNHEAGNYPFQFSYSSLHIKEHACSCDSSIFFLKVKV
jgi:hypothetical protein